MEQILISQLYQRKINSKVKPNNKILKGQHMVQIQNKENITNIDFQDFSQKQNNNLTVLHKREYQNSQKKQQIQQKYCCQIKFFYYTLEQLQKFKQNLNQIESIKAILRQNNQNQSNWTSTNLLQINLINVNISITCIEQAQSNHKKQSNNSQIQIQVILGIKNIEARENQQCQQNLHPQFKQVIYKEIPYQGKYQQYIIRFILNREISKLRNLKLLQSNKQSDNTSNNQQKQGKKSQFDKFFTNLPLQTHLYNKFQNKAQLNEFPYETKQIFNLKLNQDLNLYNQIKSFKEQNLRIQKQKQLLQQKIIEEEQIRKIKIEEEELLKKKVQQQEKIKIRRLLQVQSNTGNRPTDLSPDSLNRFYRKCACCQNGQQKGNQGQKQINYLQHNKGSIQCKKRHNYFRQDLFNLSVKCRDSKSKQRPLLNQIRKQQTEFKNLGQNEDVKTVLKARVSYNRSLQKILNHRQSKQSERIEPITKSPMIFQDKQESQVKKQRARGNQCSRQCNNSAILKNCYCCSQSQQKRPGQGVFKFLKVNKHKKAQKIKRNNQSLSHSHSFYISPVVYKKPNINNQTIQDAGTQYDQLSFMIPVQQRKTLSECDKQQFQLQYQEFKQEQQNKDSINFQSSQLWNAVNTEKQYKCNQQQQHSSNQKNKIIRNQKMNTIQKIEQQKFDKKVINLQKSQKYKNVQKQSLIKEGTKFQLLQNNNQQQQKSLKGKIFILGNEQQVKIQEKSHQNPLKINQQILSINQNRQIQKQKDTKVKSQFNQSNENKLSQNQSNENKLSQNQLFKSQTQQLRNIDQQNIKQANLQNSSLLQTKQIEQRKNIQMQKIPKKDIVKSNSQIIINKNIKQNKNIRQNSINKYKNSINIQRKSLNKIKVQQKRVPIVNSNNMNKKQQTNQKKDKKISIINQTKLSKKRFDRNNKDQHDVQKNNESQKINSLPKEKQFLVQQNDNQINTNEIIRVENKADIRQEQEQVQLNFKQININERQQSQNKIKNNNQTDFLSNNIDQQQKLIICIKKIKLQEKLMDVNNKVQLNNKQSVVVNVQSSKISNQVSEQKKIDEVKLNQLHTQSIKALDIQQVDFVNDNKMLQQCQKYQKIEVSHLKHSKVQQSVVNCVLQVKSQKILQTVKQIEQASDRLSKQSYLVEERQQSKQRKLSITNIKGKEGQLVVDKEIISNKRHKEENNKKKEYIVQQSQQMLPQQKPIKISNKQNQTSKTTNQIKQQPNFYQSSHHNSYQANNYNKEQDILLNKQSINGQEHNQIQINQQLLEKNNTITLQEQIKLNIKPIQNLKLQKNIKELQKITKEKQQNNNSFNQNKQQQKYKSCIQNVRQPPCIIQTNHKQFILVSQQNNYLQSQQKICLKQHPTKQQLLRKQIKYQQNEQNEQNEQDIGRQLQNNNKIQALKVDYKQFQIQRDQKQPKSNNQNQKQDTSLFNINNYQQSHQLQDSSQKCNIHSQTKQIRIPNSTQQQILTLSHQSQYQSQSNNTILIQQTPLKTELKQYKSIQQLNQQVQQSQNQQPYGIKSNYQTQIYSHLNQNQNENEKQQILHQELLSYTQEQQQNSLSKQLLNVSVINKSNTKQKQLIQCQKITGKHNQTIEPNNQTTQKNNKSNTNQSNTYKYNINKQQVYKNQQIQLQRNQQNQLLQKGKFEQENKFQKNQTQQDIQNSSNHLSNNFNNNLSNNFNNNISQDILECNQQQELKQPQKQQQKIKQKINVLSSSQISYQKQQIITKQNVVEQIEYVNKQRLQQNQQKQNQTQQKLKVILLKQKQSLSKIQNEPLKMIQDKSQKIQDKPLKIQDKKDIQIQTQQIVLMQYSQDNQLSQHISKNIMNNTADNYREQPPNQNNLRLSQFQNIYSNNYMNQIKQQLQQQKKIIKKFVSKLPISVALGHFYNQNQKNIYNQSNNVLYSLQSNKQSLMQDNQMGDQLDNQNHPILGNSINQSYQQHIQTINTQKYGNQSSTANKTQLQQANVSSQPPNPFMNLKALFQKKSLSKPFQQLGSKSQEQGVSLSLQQNNLLQQLQSQSASMPFSLFQKLSFPNQDQSNNKSQQNKVNIQSLLANLNNMGTIISHPAIMNQVIRSAQQKNIDQIVIVLQSNQLKQSHSQQQQNHLVSVVKYAIKFVNKYICQKFIQQKLIEKEKHEVCLFIEHQWKIFNFQKLKSSKFDKIIEQTTKLKSKINKLVQTVIIHVINKYQIHRNFDALKCVQLLTGLNFKKIRSKQHQLSIEDQKKLAKKISSFYTSNKLDQQNIYTSEKLLLNFDQTHLGLIQNLQTYKAATHSKNSSFSKSKIKEITKQTKEKEIPPNQKIEKREYIIAYKLINQELHHTQLYKSSIFLSYLTPNIKYQTLNVLQGAVNTFQLYFGNCMIVVSDISQRFILYKQTAKDKYQIVKQGKGFIKFNAPEQKCVYLLIVEPLIKKNKKQNKNQLIDKKIQVKSNQNQIKNLCIRYYFKQLAKEGFLDRLIQCLYSGKGKVSNGGYENDRNVYLPVQKQSEQKQKSQIKSVMQEMQEE